MLKKILDILNHSYPITDSVSITIKMVLILIVIFIATSFFLKLFRKIVNRRLEAEDKDKFRSIFSFLKYFVYTIVIIIALESLGVQVSVLLAGSAALLVGLGLGLQTLFQDIVSGIFIILDKTLHVNDIIEIDDKVGRVFEIKLRTTRAVTVNDKVIIIPNHKFLTNSLYNWTQNGTETTEIVEVGVAYGSDVEKVKKLLIEAAEEHPKILNKNKTEVFFMDFGDSALHFRLRFIIDDSFSQLRIKSDLRFAIDKKFREHNIQIPFPQRDVHIIQNKE
ncbi:mechanosensitive ion channel family protein [Lutibacter sp. B1]|uniref:mechanosensitive ion channel family protein n=1 Tax=Lutibacter sp. B1 TaxID=2725996 RepID=UPI0014567655|nr:mechanosensitive ion channel domain-containing protein [Lutibacter sp. B1]NLP56705.1 mechanosensitive ion channel [Lutibacter sp. B1]